MKIHKCILSLIMFALSYMAYSQNVDVFYDSNVPQIKFAAEDINTALVPKNFKVEMLPLTALNAQYEYKKVVFTLASDKSATAILTFQGGKLLREMKEQGCSTYNNQETPAIDDFLKIRIDLSKQMTKEFNQAKRS